jgi:hypothetical protein
MPKPIVNNRINYQNAYSRIIQHDIFLGQGVREGDSPTFDSLTLTGNATIQGNLYVEGNTAVLNTNIIEFEDNIILVNSKETASGVSLFQSGLEVDRGLAENFRIIYNESTSRVEVGLVSNLQPIALREASPLLNGIMVWNDSTKRIESSNQITIPLTLTSTLDSTSSSTGGFIVEGGVGIKKNVYMDGKLYIRGNTHGSYSNIWTDTSTNDFNLTSTQDINLTPNVRVNIPFNKYLSFGSNSQSIVANSVTNTLTVTSAGDINLTPSIGKKISVPNQIPITFSTDNEQIYTDSSNNIVIASSQDVYLFPNNGNANGKKVFIPVDTPVAFGNQNQYVIANINNDLTIAANNNILLNPGPTLDVKIPIDAGIRFGSGYQRITANSNNELILYSEGDIFLTPQSGSQVNLPVDTHLTFATDTQYIMGDSSGNITISPSNQLIVTSPITFTNTENASNGSTGSIRTFGGLGVTKDIYGTGSLIIKSNSSGVVQIKNNSNIDLFKINSSSASDNISIVTGNGTSEVASLDITTLNNLNAHSLIQLKANYDSTSGYMLGRGTSSLNNGRSLTINLPDYSDYSNTGNRSKFTVTSTNCSNELFSVESETGNVNAMGQTTLTNVTDSTSSSTGNLVVEGGVGIKKSVYTSGKIIQTVNDTSAYQLQDDLNNVLFNNDSIAKKITINEVVEVNSQDYNAFKITDTFTDIIHIDTIDKKYTSLLQHNITNTIDSTDTSNGSVIIDGGVGIKKNLNVGGNTTFSNGVNMNNTRIANVLDPILPQDAATKAYVDLVKQGIFVKDSVKAATTSDINLNSTLVTGGAIDNVTLVVGDRILVKNQGNPIENGIYNVTDGIPVRSSDLVVGNRAAGIFTFVKAGDINASLGWICNSPLDQDTVGTHDLNFTQFTGLGQVTAGVGLIKDFNQLNINVDNISLEVTPVTGELRIKDTAVGTGLTGGSGSPLQTITDQSHVTKLGTIDTGAWQASVIGIPYGGTGNSNFNAGNILFGNNANPISTDPNFYFDNINTRLGVGTNVPSEDLEIRSNNTTTFFINADSDANNSTARPEIRLSYNGTLNNAHIALTRDFNQFANQTYSDALIISNDQTTTNSRIQLATNQTARMTILSNGFVGINTSNPSVRLQVNGNMNVTDNTKFFATNPSTSITEGAMVISGGLSISCPTNSIDINNGGGLTIEGGASIGKDLYVGGSINSVTASSNTFSYLTISATDEAINLTTGSFLTFGGITIQCTTDATSVTDGGSLLTPGGASIGASLYVGSTMYGLSDTFLGNLYMYSTADDNYIQPPDSDRNTNSFLPINFTKYNNTSANTLTIADSGIVLNNNHTIQIGGSLQTPDGYTLQYITNNLNITPNDTNSNYNINIGTIGSYSNLNIYGNNSGQIRWDSTTSNLLITHSSIQFNKVDSSGSIVITTPMNQSSESYIQASGSNMILNLGTGSTGGQLITTLTNDVGDSSMTFTPSNVSSSTLVLTNNVYSTFNGPVSFTDRVEYSGNALHQTITNIDGNSLWVYMGQINTIGGESGYCEIDFNNGVNMSSNNLSGLKLMVAINNTTCIASHSHYGNIQFDSIDKPICYIYNDNINDYHLFVKVAPNSQTNINVTAQHNTKFLILREGDGNTPSGISSGYTGTWTVEYNTQHESTLKYTTGDLVVEKQAKINDNLPIIGYNNENTVASRDIGLLYQRYQVSNDYGSGDIVNGTTTPQFIDSIPNQSIISSLSQIKFSNLANSIDNYYVGWWIKIVSGSNTNQVRKITSYTGAQRIALLDEPFTTQNPNNGASVNFYNNSYVVSYYDEINDTFAFGYTDSKPTNGIVNNNDNANLRIKSLYATDTTVSTNASSGSIHLLGGISISNTTDSQSSSYGGTITTAGGIGIRKDLRVGNNIGLGTSGFTTEESIHIRKPIATSRFEHNTGSYSYMDFMENDSSSRYGIIFDSTINQLCLTNTNSSQTPNNSNRALTINNLGYVGINTTTNVVSPLAVNMNNFISTNSTTGYLGLVGGATNVNGNTIGSRILLCANDQATNTSEGCLNLHAGNVNTGNVSIFTNDDIERLRVDNKGSVNITSTQVSDSSSNGSLIISGGIGIDCTQNATSISSGGALTVAGGVSINKNLYIGGDIFITGSFTAQGAITQPTITQYNTINCTFIELFNNNLSASGNFANLTFAFSVTPSNSSENCTIEFSLPARSNAFIKRFEIVSSCTGYTDDADITPLMNVLSYGELGTPRLKVKFQSVSTSIHHFQVICAYIHS